MALSLITGPANAGKARAVLQRLRAHAARGQRPLLVVPTGADADRYRRELAEQGPVSGVEVSLFAGLMERLARCAAEQRPGLAQPPLGSLAREGALCAIACELRPELADRRHGLGRALAESIAELQAAGVRPDLLGDALADPTAGGRERRLGAAVLGEVYRRYRERLAALGLLDAELRARQALDVLRSRPDLWRERPVLIYGFDDLATLQLDAIETLAGVVDAPVTVSLLYEQGRIAFAGRESTAAVLMPLAREHVLLEPRAEYYAAQARTALHRLERSIFEVEPAGERVDPGSCVRLLEGADERGELELVAAEVRALIDGGMPAAEIAVVHRSPAAVAELLDEAFESLQVPHQLAGATRFAATALGRGLLGLLACGCEGVDGAGEASAGQLLAWLRTPGVLDRPELADRLEERALRTGVRTAAALRSLWERERWGLDRIDAVRDAALRGLAALIERAERELLWLFEAPRRRAAAVLDGSEQEGLALRAGLSLLAELRMLADRTPDLLGGVRGVLDALSALLAPCPQRHDPDSVSISDPLSLRARRVRALFLCGLQEGVFPAPSGSQPLMSEAERGRLAELGGSRLRWRDEPVAAERYLLYATVSRPEELLVLSWHLTGADGEPTPPSLFLDDVCDCFAPDLRERRRLVLEAAGLASAGSVPPRYVPSGSVVPLRSGAAAGPGVLADERLLAELSARAMWSASSLERWAACPVSWFVEHSLGPAEMEPEPEPLLRGGLAHRVLREIMERLRESTGSARITAARLGHARELMHEALRRHSQGSELSVLPERQVAAMRRLEADLDGYLAFAATQEAVTEPAYLELPFGFPELPGSLPALQLGDGVMLRGRIDRVDLTADGEAIVYDYKSGRVGSEHAGAKWSQGMRLQIPLYMRVVAELIGVPVRGGLYQPLAGGDLRARGAVLTGTPLDCVRTDIVDRERLHELMQEGSAAALAAARQARAGMLESRPATCTPGGGCRYRAICRCAS